MMRFNELVQIVKTDRNGQHAPKLEQKLLQELKDSSAGNRASQLEIQQQKRKQDDILLAALQPFNELHYLQPDQPPPHAINNDSIKNGDSHGAHHIVVQDDVVNCSSV